MKKSRFTEEQIIGIVKQHEAGLKAAVAASGPMPGTVCSLRAGRAYLWRALPEVMARAGVSERRACKLLGVDRASYRNEPRPDRNAELREELVELAREKPRYSYRRLHAVLERRGEGLNVKRSESIGLSAVCGTRSGRAATQAQAAGARSRCRAAIHSCQSGNQEWAMDFSVDGLANGRMVRILSVIDAFIGECLALEADTNLGSGSVRWTLDNYREEYNCERPHSSLAYRTPAEFRSPDYDGGEIYSPTNLNLETPVIAG